MLVSECSLSHVQLFLTPVDCWGPLLMGFSRQEYWSGLPFPSPNCMLVPRWFLDTTVLIHFRSICFLLWLFSHSFMSFSLPPQRLQHTSLPWPTQVSLLTLMSIESVMPSDHLILCRPLLLPSVLSLVGQKWVGLLFVQIRSCVPHGCTILGARGANQDDFPDPEDAPVLPEKVGFHWVILMFSLIAARCRSQSRW